MARMKTAQEMAQGFKSRGWTKGAVLLAAEDARERAAHWNEKGNEFLAISPKVATIAFRKQDEENEKATQLRAAAQMM